MTGRYIVWMYGTLQINESHNKPGFLACVCVCARVYYHQGMVLRPILRPEEYSIFYLKKTTHLSVQIPSVLLGQSLTSHVSWIPIETARSPSLAIGQATNHRAAKGPPNPTSWPLQCASPVVPRCPGELSKDLNCRVNSKTYLGPLLHRSCLANICKYQMSVYP